MKNIFVSILGTQAFGTLNAWLSARKTWPPDKVFLLYNNDRAEIAARLIEDVAKELDLEEIEAREVSVKKPEDEKYAPKVVVGLAREAAERGERIVFNINGGTNYIICACLLALAPYAPILLNSSFDRVIYYDPARNEITAGAKPPTLPIETVLRAQGIDYSLEAGRSPFIVARDDAGLQLPENSLQNVSIRERNSHRATRFDLIWNPGDNTMSYLINAEIAKWSDRAREKSRNIANFAANTDKSNDSFDHSVYVVANSQTFAQRALMESLREPEVLVGSLDLPRYPGSTYYKTIKAWFSGKKETKPSPPASPRPAALEELGDGALVVRLGSMPASTLSAIASHRPERLILCRQPRNKAIEATLPRIKTFAKRHGVKRVDVIDFDVDGARADLCLPAVRPGASAHLNATPGTKAQGAMLTLWARERDVTVWTLNRGAGSLSPLHNPRGLPAGSLVIVDPLDELRAGGKIIRKPGRRADNIARATPAFSALLDFLREALLAKDDDKLLPQPISNRRGELKPAENGDWLFKSGPFKTRIPINDGFWFENMTAVAFNRAGAVKTRAGTQIVNPKNNSVNLAEIDIVAVMGSNQIRVSCKAFGTHKLAMTRAAAREAEDTAQNINRFALPILADLSVDKGGLLDRVLVVGWRELYQPDLLRKLVGEFGRLKQTAADPAPSNALPQFLTNIKQTTVKAENE